MDGFYRQTFERRYAEERSYADVKPILGLLCAQLEPLTYHAIAAILKSSPLSVSRALKPLNDLLHLLPVPDAEGGERGDRRCSFAHLSLEQWLSQEKPDDLEHWAGRFAADRASAEEQIRIWALEEVAAHRAHTWPYLVRHLASHLPEPKREAVQAELLGRFAWLEARLRLVGIKGVLADLSVAEQAVSRQGSSGAAYTQLKRALQQSAHLVVANDGRDGIQGHYHLANQLLARLPKAFDDPISQSLRRQAREWIYEGGGVAPRCASLVDSSFLLRSLYLTSGVLAVLALPDGRLACGCSDGTIKLLDPDSGICSAVFEGHQKTVWALAILEDGRLVSGSEDRTIRLWDLTRSELGGGSVVYTEQKGMVTALVVLPDGRLASGSSDATIRLWDLACSETGGSSVVFEGHQGGVLALAVLPGGRLASGSSDSTIRVWDLARSETGGSSVVLERHKGGVWALAVLPDGRLASGSKDSTIRLWDLAPSAAGGGSVVFEGSQSCVTALKMLPDGRLASGSEGGTIHLWDLAHSETAGGSVVFEGHQKTVWALAVLPDGRLASGSGDHTIRLWDPTTPTGAPQLLFVADAAITALVCIPSHQLLVAGDASGRLHWLEIAPLKR
jgi:WD40 repeat protein